MFFSLFEKINFDSNALNKLARKAAKFDVVSFKPSLPIYPKTSSDKDSNTRMIDNTSRLHAAWVSIGIHCLCISPVPHMELHLETRLKLMGSPYDLLELSIIYIPKIL